MTSTPSTTGGTHVIEWLGRDDLSAQGSCSVRLFSDSECNSRANSFLLKAALCGLLAVIVPPHIIYPAIGLIVGFIGRASIKKQKYVFLSGEVSCPKCGSNEKLPKSTQQFPFIYFCSKCSSRAEIRCADFPET
ncbi:MAG: hypothetical protein RJB13_1622 [Pseudomonadota bacterium]